MLNFTTTVVNFGKYYQIDLIKYGKNIDLTDSNKKVFAKLLANYKMTEEIRP